MKKLWGLSPFGECWTILVRPAVSDSDIVVAVRREHVIAVLTCASLPGLLAAYKERAMPGIDRLRNYLDDAQLAHELCQGRLR